MNRYNVIRRKRDTEDSNIFSRFGRNIKSKLDSNLYKVTNDISKKNANLDAPILRRNKIPRIFWNEKIGNRKNKRGILLRHKRNAVQPMQHRHAYQAPHQYSCQPFAIPVNSNNYYQSYYLEPVAETYPKQQNYQEKPNNERTATEYPEEYYLDKIQNALYSKPNFVKGDELDGKLTIGPLQQAQQFVEFIKDISHGKYNQIVDAETITNSRPKKSNSYSEEAPPLTIIPLEDKKENVNYLKKSLFREDSEKKKMKSIKKSSKLSSHQFSSLEQTLMQSESGETYLIKILSDNDSSDKENKIGKSSGKDISHESLLEAIKNGEVLNKF